MQVTLQFPKSSLTFLIGLNIFLWVVITILSFVAGPRNFEIVYSNLLIGLGAMSSSLVVHAGEVWRIVASLFLHVDILHLGFNMFALYQLGRVIEQYYGGKLLFVFYIVCGIGGSLLSIVFLAPNIPTVGASGAVFGLLGVLIAGSIKKNRYGLDLPFKPSDILPLAVYALLFGFIPGSGVNNFAHIGGLLTGLALGFLFNHQLVVKSKQQEKLSQAMYYLSLIVLIVTYFAVAFSFIQVLFEP